MPRIEPTLSGVSEEVENPYQLSEAQLVDDDVVTFSKPRVFDLSGRISLSNYWLFHMAFVVGVPTCLLAFFIFGLQRQPMVLFLAAVTVLVFSCLLSTSLLMRRARDLSWSPAWGIIAMLPFIGLLIMLPLVLLPGRKVKNKYGSPNALMSNREKIFTCLLIVIVCLGITALFAYFPKYGMAEFFSWFFSYWGGVQ